MAWTYSGDPSDSQKDAIRYIVGDTSSDEGFVQDEEIQFAIDTTSNLYSAAAMVADNLSRYFATQAEQIKVGPLVELYSHRSVRYAAVALKLETKAARSSSITFVCGGVTTADAVPASFFIGMHDFSLPVNE